MRARSNSRPRPSRADSAPSARGGCSRAINNHYGTLAPFFLALLRQSDGDPAEVTRADTSDDDTTSANDGEAPLTRLAEPVATTEL